MMTVKLSKNEETGSAFLCVYEGDHLLLGLDVRADGSHEIHDWNGFAGDTVYAIYSVLSDLVDKNITLGE